jgi:Zn finger protein HypA/HybF involved in hydrogenase expression
MTTDDADRVSQCVNCGVEQPFLLSLNSQIEVVNFICNECGHQQTRIVGEDTERTAEVDDAE